MNVARELNSSARLLLIDDDRELGRLMSQFLAGANFQVECAVDGLSGLKTAQTKPFDLILLDVGLPLLDGFSVLESLRQTTDIPVIMLTSRSTVADRLIGLNNGADDYLAKPFDPDELAARIRAVMRRYESGHRPVSTAKTFGAIRVIESERTVFVHGSRLDLTTIEYEILLMLSRASGSVVKRDALTQSILGRAPNFFDRSLDVHVSRIRAKLGCEGKLIRTIRGEGYALIMPEEAHVSVA